MGSLSSPSRIPTPPPSPEFNPSSHRIIASFCLREPTGPKSNMSNWIECYNPSNNTWSYASTIPDLIENHVIKGFSMVSLGDSIYIIGGRSCYKEKIITNTNTNDNIDEEEADEHVEVDVEVLSIVLRYNVKSDEWTKCASLSVPRYDFACSVCDNKIYVAGGKSNLDSNRGISLAEVYDPNLDEWTNLPNMSTLRYKCVGVTWQGKIYVVGGFAERGDSDNSDGRVSFTERSSAEMYDTIEKKWELMQGMWQLDTPPNQIVEVENRLFSSGDCLQAWKGHIEAYDGKLNIWNEVDGSHLQTLNSPISTSSSNESWPPIQRLYLTVAAIGTHLCFLAGYRMAGELSRTMTMVHIFDTEATSYGWRSFEPMLEEGEKELCSHCCVVQLS